MPASNSHARSGHDAHRNGIFRPCDPYLSASSDADFSSSPQPTKNTTSSCVSGGERRGEALDIFSVTDQNRGNALIRRSDNKGESSSHTKGSAVNERASKSSSSLWRGMNRSAMTRGSSTKFGKGESEVRGAEESYDSPLMVEGSSSQYREGGGGADGVEGPQGISVGHGNYTTSSFPSESSGKSDAGCTVEVGPSSTDASTHNTLVSSAFYNLSSIPNASRRTPQGSRSTGFYSLGRLSNPFYQSAPYSSGKTSGYLCAGKISPLPPPPSPHSVTGTNSTSAPSNKCVAAAAAVYWKRSNANGCTNHQGSGSNGYLEKSSSESNIIMKCGNHSSTRFHSRAAADEVTRTQEAVPAFSSPHSTLSPSDEVNSAPSASAQRRPRNTGNAWVNDGLLENNETHSPPLGGLSGGKDMPFAASQVTGDLSGAPCCDERPTTAGFLAARQAAPYDRVRRGNRRGLLELLKLRADVAVLRSRQSLCSLEQQQHPFQRAGVPIYQQMKARGPMFFFSDDGNGKGGASGAASVVVENKKDGGWWVQDGERERGDNWVEEEEERGKDKSWGREDDEKGEGESTSLQHCGAGRTRAAYSPSLTTEFPSSTATEKSSEKKSASMPPSTSGMARKGNNFFKNDNGSTTSSRRSSLGRTESERRRKGGDSGPPRSHSTDPYSGNYHLSSSLPKDTTRFPLSSAPDSINLLVSSNASSTVKDQHPSGKDAGAPPPHSSISMDNSLPHSFDVNSTSANTTSASAFHSASGAPPGSGGDGSLSSNRDSFPSSSHRSSSAVYVSSLPWEAEQVIKNGKESNTVSLNSLRSQELSPEGAAGDVRKGTGCKQLPPTLPITFPPSSLSNELPSPTHAAIQQEVDRRSAAVAACRARSEKGEEDGEDWSGEELLEPMVEKECVHTTGMIADASSGRSAPHFYELTEGEIQDELARRSCDAVGLSPVLASSMPKGRYVVINMLTTWGDNHEVGLCEIEFYNDRGERVLSQRGEGNDVFHAPDGISGSPSCLSAEEVGEGILPADISTASQVGIGMSTMEAPLIMEPQEATVDKTMNLVSISSASVDGFLRFLVEYSATPEDLSLWSEGEEYSKVHSFPPRSSMPQSSSSVSGSRGDGVDGGRASSSSMPKGEGNRQMNTEPGCAIPSCRPQRTDAEKRIQEDPRRQITAVIDGVVHTHDESHMLSLPYTPGHHHLLCFVFAHPICLSMIRIYNYCGRGRAQTFKGVRIAEIVMDNEVIFRGEIQRHSGALTLMEEDGSIGLCKCENILFTEDKNVLAHIISGNRSRGPFSGFSSTSGSGTGQKGEDEYENGGEQKTQVGQGIGDMNLGKENKMGDEGVWSGVGTRDNGEGGRTQPTTGRLNEGRALLPLPSSATTRVVVRSRPLFTEPEEMGTERPMTWLGGDGGKHSTPCFTDGNISNRSSIHSNGNDRRSKEGKVLYNVCQGEVPSSPPSSSEEDSQKQRKNHLFLTYPGGSSARVADVTMESALTKSTAEDSGRNGHQREGNTLTIDSTSPSRCPSVEIPGNNTRLTHLAHGTSLSNQEGESTEVGSEPAHKTSQTDHTTPAVNLSSHPSSSSSDRYQRQPHRIKRAQYPSRCPQNIRSVCFLFLATWGDPHRIGLSGLRFRNATGQLVEESVYAWRVQYPDGSYRSVEDAATFTEQVRFLFDENVKTACTLPFVPGMQLVIVFDRPISTLGFLEVANYSVGDTTYCGVKEVRLFLSKGDAVTKRQENTRSGEAEREGDERWYNLGIAEREIQRFRELWTYASDPKSRAALRAGRVSEVTPACGVSLRKAPAHLSIPRFQAYDLSLQGGAAGEPNQIDAWGETSGSNGGEISREKDAGDETGEELHQPLMDCIGVGPGTGGGPIDSEQLNGGGGGGYCGTGYFATSFANSLNASMNIRAAMAIRRARMALRDRPEWLLQYQPYLTPLLPVGYVCKVKLHICAKDIERRKQLPYDFPSGEGMMADYHHTPKRLVSETLKAFMREWVLEPFRSCAFVNENGEHIRPLLTPEEEEERRNQKRKRRAEQKKQEKLSSPAGEAGKSMELRERDGFYATGATTSTNNSSDNGCGKNITFENNLHRWQREEQLGSNQTDTRNESEHTLPSRTTPFMESFPSVGIKEEEGRVGQEGNCDNGGTTLSEDEEDDEAEEEEEGLCRLPIVVESVISPIPPPNTPYQDKHALEVEVDLIYVTDIPFCLAVLCLSGPLVYNGSAAWVKRLQVCMDDAMIYDSGDALISLSKNSRKSSRLSVSSPLSSRSSLPFSSGSGRGEGCAGSERNSIHHKDALHDGSMNLSDSRGSPILQWDQGRGMPQDEEDPSNPVRRLALMPACASSIQPYVLFTLDSKVLEEVKHTLDEIPLNT